MDLWLARQTNPVKARGAVTAETEAEVAASSQVPTHHNPTDQRQAEWSIGPLTNALHAGPAGGALPGQGSRRELGWGAANDRITSQRPGSLKSLLRLGATSSIHLRCVRKAPSSSIESIICCFGFL